MDIVQSQANAFVPMAGQEKTVLIAEFNQIVLVLALCLMDVFVLILRSTVFAQSVTIHQDYQRLYYNFS
jgi:hypothetical protein